MPAIAISPQRRDEILDALRHGTVPAASLDILAVGLEPLRRPSWPSLTACALAAVRSRPCAVNMAAETFFARWFEELARREGFATLEVQFSEPKRRCTG